RMGSSRARRRDWDAPRVRRRGATFEVATRYRRARDGALRNQDDLAFDPPRGEIAERVRDALERIRRGDPGLQLAGREPIHQLLDVRRVPGGLAHGERAPE